MPSPEPRGGTHETYRFTGALVSILIDGDQTNGVFALLEGTVPPGGATPPHLHQYEDETYLCTAGTLRIETAGSVFVLSPGQCRLLPHAIAHRLSNPGTTELKYLVTLTPAGFENLVRAAGARVVAGDFTADAEQAGDTLLQIAGKYGVQLADEAHL